MQSIFLPDLPVFSACFIQDGSQALLTGNRKHFYSYDLSKNKLEKHTVGTLDQKNLSSISTGSDYFCISQAETGGAHIFSQKSKK